MKTEVITPGGRATVVAETTRDLRDVADAAGAVLDDGSAEFYRNLTPPIGIGRAAAEAAVKGFEKGVSSRAAEHLVALVGIGHEPSQGL
jgi:hypothetical protein